MKRKELMQMLRGSLVVCLLYRIVYLLVAKDRLEASLSFSILFTMGFWGILLVIVDLTDLTIDLIIGSPEQSEIIKSKPKFIITIFIVAALMYVLFIACGHLFTLSHLR